MYILKTVLAEIPNTKNLFDYLVGSRTLSFDFGNHKLILSHPVMHNRPFSLLELARMKIYNTEVTYEDISKLEIPEELKIFLREHKFKDLEQTIRFD